MNKTAKTYAAQLSLALVFYAATLVASQLLLQRLPGSDWRIPLAVLPVLPVAFGLRAFMRYLRQVDELQRRIQLDAIAFGAGMTALLTFTYGFLELADFPPISVLWVLPILTVLWGIGLLRASWRYR